MKKFSLIICVLVFGLQFSCQTSGDVVTMESLLEEMIDKDRVARYPKSNFRLKQAGSYNRASVNPKDSIGWFNNIDRYEYIRVDTIEGKPEWVLMDHIGAGAIVRSWMPFLKPNKPGTDIQLKIYLDGSTEPVLEGNMLGLFDGSGMIPFPFAHKSLRSSVSFFPIPYAKSCKITVSEEPFFYQFTYREYPKNTKVKSFTMDDFQAASTLTEEVGKKLLSPNRTEPGEMLVLESSLGPKQERSIDLPTGPAAVKALSFKLGSYEDSSVTRSVIIKMNCDGKETIWCPVGDFFGTGIGLNPFQGWYRTVAEDGTLSCRWTMPYRESAKITVENLGTTPIDFDLEVHVDDWNWDDNSMYFHAGWRNQYPVLTRPYSDWNYVTIEGRGVYVGDALTIFNPVEKWWGEGDEKIWVDGEDFPSIFGTGTEDYYAYSWGGISTDFYEHPFHAQPRAYLYNKLNRKTTSEKNTLGYSTETRTRALDIMPFSRSLKLDMEIWSWTECEMAYTVGVYWYGDFDSKSNHVPAPSDLILPDFEMDVTNNE